MVGIRDSYGEVLPNEYIRFEVLDNNGDYIAAYEPLTYYGRWGHRSTKKVIQIFDLRHKQFIFQGSVYFGIDSIARINDKEYKLFNDYGRDFARLRLPGKYADRFETYASVVPHFSDSDVTLSEFIRLGNISMSIPDAGYWKEMYESDSIAYRFLHRISSMSNVTSSPENDLRYAQALCHFARIESHYDGCLEKAFDDVHNILELLGSGNTSDMTRAASFERLMANASLSIRYDSMAQEFPQYNEEYRAWHNMMEAIICYSDFVIDNDEDNHYLYRDMDNEYSKKEIYDERRRQLETEKRILTGELRSLETPDSLKTKDDVNKILTDITIGKHLIIGIPETV